MRKYIFIPLLSFLISLLLSCSGSAALKGNNNHRLMIFDFQNPMNPSDSLRHYEMFNEDYNKTFDPDLDLYVRFIAPIDISDYGDFSLGEEVLEYNNDGIALLPIELFHKLFSERDEYFIPLDDYLYSSDIAGIWPQSLLEYGKFPGDNKTWCLPTSYGSQINLRAYNKEVLEEMNIQPPTNADEFKSALTLYFELYGKAPLHVKPYSNEFMKPLTDLFSMSGIPATDTIIFDRNLGQYINIIDNENTEEMIYLMEGLLNSELIEVTEESENDYTKVTENDLFSALLGGHFYTELEDLIFRNLEIPTSGLVSKNNRYKRIRWVAVILKDTDNPGKTLDDFIETFLVSGDEYIAFSRGYLNTHYEMYNGYLRPIQYPEYKKPDVISILDYDIDYNINNKDRSDYIEYKEAYISDRNIIEPYYLNFFLELNVFESNSQRNSIQEFFNTVFSKLLTTDESADDLIAEYERLCMENGVDDLIEKANSELKQLFQNN